MGRWTTINAGSVRRYRSPAPAGGDVVGSGLCSLCLHAVLLAVFTCMPVPSKGVAWLDLTASDLTVEASQEKNTVTTRFERTFSPAPRGSGAPGEAAEAAEETDNDAAEAEPLHLDTSTVASIRPAPLQKEVIAHPMPEAMKPAVALRAPAAKEQRWSAAPPPASLPATKAPSPRPAVQGAVSSSRRYQKPPPPAPVATPTGQVASPPPAQAPPATQTQRNVARTPAELPRPPIASERIGRAMAATPHSAKDAPIVPAATLPPAAGAPIKVTAPRVASEARPPAEPPTHAIGSISPSGSRAQWIPQGGLPTQSGQPLPKPSATVAGGKVPVSQGRPGSAETLAEKLQRVVAGTAPPSRAVGVSSSTGDLEVRVTMDAAARAELAIKVLYWPYPRARHKKPMSREESKRAKILLPSVATSASGSVDGIIETADDGIYEFTAVNRSDGATTGKCAVTVFGRGKNRRVRELGARKLAGETRIVTVLMPEGLLWEDDSSFDGSIEDSDSTTKFISETGLAWRKYK